jgi:hypothetical protein
VEAANLIVTTSVPRWMAGFHQELIWPCGQVACWVPGVDGEAGPVLTVVPDDDVGVAVRH